MSSVPPSHTLLRLWKEVAWPERRSLLWGLASMGVLALATGAYAFLSGPVLRHLFTGAAEGISLPLPFSLGTLRLSAETAQLALPASLVGFGVIRGGAYLGQFFAMGWFGQRAAARLRRRVFQQLLRRSPLALDEARTGELLQRFTGDIAVIESAATYAAASYLRDGSQLLVLALLALWLDPRMALLGGAAIALVALPTLRISRSVLRGTRQAQEHLSALGGELQEGLRELPTLQAFGAEAAAEERFARSAIGHRRAIVRAGWKRAAVPALTEVIAAVGLAALVGSTLVGGGASARLVSFVATVLLMYQPAKDLSRNGQLGLQAAVAGERLWLLLDAPPGIEDRPGARAAPPAEREISLEDVHFSYGGREALRGASLTLPIGQITALVGPSGAGKSSVARLLVRAARPDAGRLVLDGADAETLSIDSVRAQIALVTQEAQLFHGTVLDNLRLGSAEASIEDVEEACRAADAHGFIVGLPAGYRTLLGEGGVGLSGGQRQRICLARALLKRAPLLLLDEATAGLDPESEREVQRALDRVLPGRTALLIAHRLHTVQNAHRIYVMDAGHVVEQGTHAELLAQDGVYARLWQIQSPAGVAA